MDTSQSIEPLFGVVTETTTVTDVIIAINTHWEMLIYSALIAFVFAGIMLLFTKCILKPII